MLKILECTVYDWLEIGLDCNIHVCTDIIVMWFEYSEDLKIFLNHLITQYLQIHVVATCTHIIILNAVNRERSKFKS